MSHRHGGGQILVAALAVCLSVPVGALARAAPAEQTVRYAGYEVQVPGNWPIYDLAADPATCVRMDRHAVYLGAAGPAERCPAHVVGHSEALLIEPLGASGTPPGTVTAPPGSVVPATWPPTDVGSVMLAVPAAGVWVMATWRTQPGLIRQMLGGARIAAGHSSVPTTRIPSSAAPAQANTAAVPDATATPVGGPYSGFGFDTCNAPTQTAMNAWRTSSPYRAVGIYIGGANAACRNLTASWVSTELAAGWRLIPTYVGLQAPGSSCSDCAQTTLASAAADGKRAADDAASRARLFGLGQCTTIYFDMEAYSTGGTRSTAALAFLAAWTRELHALGDKSGVYSSAATDIADLVKQIGTGYLEPDDVWVADWDGIATTSDRFVPSGDWPHSRLRQYNGDRTETWGRVTLNVDEDALDGAVARAAVPGYWLTTSKGNVYNFNATWYGSLAGTTVPAPVVGTARTCDSGGYWLATSKGNVYNFNTTWYGSMAGKPLPAAVVGMSTTADSRGYWLATTKGNVYNFGNAPWYGSLAGKPLPAPVVGITSAPNGKGYWLTTTKGNVYNFNTAWYGSLAGKPLPAAVVGMSTTADSRGYWLATSKGNVYNFGNAPWYGSLAGKPLPAPVVGITSAPNGKGYWLTTSKGNVYNFNVGWYGSMAGKTLPAPVVGVEGAR